jgi:hypothetical protein
VTSDREAGRPCYLTLCPGPGRPPGPLRAGNHRAGDRRARNQRARNHQAGNRRAEVGDAQRLPSSLAFGPASRADAPGVCSRGRALPLSFSSCRLTPYRPFCCGLERVAEERSHPEDGAASNRSYGRGRRLPAAPTRQPSAWPRSGSCSVGDGNGRAKAALPCSPVDSRALGRSRPLDPWGPAPRRS